MVEHIFRCENYSRSLTHGIEEMCALMPADWYGTLHEEIVRCRDCKYYHDGTTNGRRYAEPHCLAIGELAYGALFEVDEDCFCSWGERK